MCFRPLSVLATKIFAPPSSPLIFNSSPAGHTPRRCNFHLSQRSRLTMPTIRRQQQLPSTWRLVLNGYSERGLDRDGAIATAHRPFGGNINDYRYGYAGRSYAEEDEGTVGAARTPLTDLSSPSWSGAALSASGAAPSSPRRGGGTVSSSTAAAMPMYGVRGYGDGGDVSGKRYRTRRELDTLAGIGAHTNNTAARQRGAAGGHRPNGGPPHPPSPQRSGAVMTVREALQHHYSTAYVDLAPPLRNPIHSTPLSPTPRGGGAGPSAHPSAWGGGGGHENVASFYPREIPRRPAAASASGQR